MCCWDEKTTSVSSVWTLATCPRVTDVSSQLSMGTKQPESRSLAQPDRGAEYPRSTNTVFP